jgi:hypothetical protein
MTDSDYRGKIEKFQNRESQWIQQLLYRKHRPKACNEK